MFTADFPCVLITEQHAAQVVQTHINAKSEKDCLVSQTSKEFKPDSIVHCPDNDFCRSQLQPTRTDSLKLLSPKNCLVLTSNQTFCTELDTQLQEAGMFEALNEQSFNTESKVCEKN